jgi:hypothetical protein
MSRARIHSAPDASASYERRRRAQHAVLRVRERVRRSEHTDTIVQRGVATDSPCDERCAATDHERATVDEHDGGAQADHDAGTTKRKQHRPAIDDGCCAAGSDDEPRRGRRTADVDVEPAVVEQRLLVVVRRVGDRSRRLVRAAGVGLCAERRAGDPAGAAICRSAGDRRCARGRAATGSATAAACCSSTTSRRARWGRAAW